MALDESFKSVQLINQWEVFELTGRPRSYRALGPSGFEGPVAEWAEKRMRDIGETIVPRIVYKVNLPDNSVHTVAWAYHDSLDMKTGEGTCMHHVVCDCEPLLEDIEDPEAKALVLGNCVPLKKALQVRSETVNRTLGIAEIFQFFRYKHDADVSRQGDDVRYFIQESIKKILEHDYLHPDSWMANVESGWQHVNMLAMTLGIPPDHLPDYLDQLEDEGHLTQEDVQVRLTNEAIAEIEERQQTIRENRFDINEITDFLREQDEGAGEL